MPLSHERPWRKTAVVAPIVLAVIGFAIHGWYAAGADALDSDRALVLLMARRFAHGEFSTYFWQQNYMGALEPLLLTPLALLGLATPVAASVVAIALTTGLCAISVRLARRLGGSPWMTVLTWAVPPAVVVHHHVSLYGARLVATLVAFGAFAIALEARARGAWVVAGVMTGFAYFGDHLMLPWVAAVIYLASRRGALVAFALGAVPVVAADTVAAMVTPAFHLAGPNAPVSWPANVALLFGTVIPQLFGLVLSRAPAPPQVAPAPIIPDGPGWMLFAATGAVTLGALAGAMFQRQRADRNAGDDDADSRLATRALVLACAAAMALFVLVGGGGDRWSVRYLIPLWPALSVLAALGVAQWRAPWRVLGALVILPALFTLRTDESWPRGADGSRADDEVVAVRQAVRASGATAVWADYWDTYRMALLAGEKPRWLALRIIERRPDWVREANASGRVAYLLRTDDREMLDRLGDASARGVVRAEPARTIGRYSLTVTDRSLPSLVEMNPAPARWWQRLAALAGGGIFLATILVAWAEGRLTRRSRASTGQERSTATRT